MVFGLPYGPGSMICPTRHDRFFYLQTANHVDHVFFAPCNLLPLVLWRTTLRGIIIYVILPSYGRYRAWHELSTREQHPFEFRLGFGRRRSFEIELLAARLKRYLQ